MKLDINKQKRINEINTCLECQSKWRVIGVDNSAVNMSAVSYGQKNLSKGNGCDYCLPAGDWRYNPFAENNGFLSLSSHPIGDNIEHPNPMIDWLKKNKG